jgi:hypothetical protein
MIPFPRLFRNDRVSRPSAASEQRPVDAGIDPAFEDDEYELEEQIAALRRLTF